MPDVKLPFSRGEYAERLRGTRQAMNRAGVEVLFTCDPSLFQYEDEPEGRELEGVVGGVGK